MPEAISPYALLRASKPKPAPTIVTAYDLYSAAQSASAPAVQAAGPQPSSPESVREPARESAPAVSASRMQPAYARRTHYISDIQTRHNAAMRRTVLRNPPLT